MTEKEKMLQGKQYDSRDPELLQMYHRARRLLKAYNQVDSDQLAERRQLLEELLERCEPGVWIESPFFCDYGSNISIGAHTFLNTHCVLLDCHKITIGKNGLIGPFVQIYTVSHPLKAAERLRVLESETRYVTFAQPVTIGDDVWIGGNTIIFPGVTIGDGVTIGAGSLVTQDLPDQVLAYGNPCRVIRKL